MSQHHGFVSRSPKQRQCKVVTFPKRVLHPTTGIRGPSPTWRQKVMAFNCNPKLHHTVSAASPQTRLRLRHRRAGGEAASAGPLPGAFSAGLGGAGARTAATMHARRRRCKRAG